MFDQVVVLAHGRTLYTGVGGFVPVEHLAGTGHAPPYTHGYNVADYLLEVASDPPLEMLSRDHTLVTKEGGPGDVVDAVEKGMTTPLNRPSRPWFEGGEYAATFLTQVQVLSGREWKVLRRSVISFWTG